MQGRLHQLLEHTRPCVLSPASFDLVVAFLVLILSSLPQCRIFILSVCFTDDYAVHTIMHAGAFL
jgi:hypothetical protein